MSETTDPAPISDTATPDTSHRPSFITPKMIEKNPVLAVAGMFAGDPYWEELMVEIKKERARQRRRDARHAK